MVEDAKFLPVLYDWKFANRVLFDMSPLFIGKLEKIDEFVEFADDTVKLKTYSLPNVILHELGHSLGLKHDVSGNNDGLDVMDAYYSADRISLSDRDIYRILLKYPRRIFSRWSHYGRLKKWLRRKKLRF